MDNFQVAEYTTFGAQNPSYKIFHNDSNITESNKNEVSFGMSVDLQKFNSSSKPKIVEP
jgi:hypothetical protein